MADDWIYHFTRAIILSHVSKLAQEKNFYARSQSKTLDGPEMLKFFKDKYSIHISESMFKSLRQCLTEVLDNYDLQNAKIADRFTLKSLLHIYIAHIGCLRPLKMTILQNMTMEEMKE